MKEHVINDIKFTLTEYKVISCFTNFNSCKPSTIARILGKSIRTIYSHIDKIKSKTNANSISDISLFVRKSKNFQYLENCFNNLYIEYHFRELAKKINYKLKSQSTICNLFICTEINQSKIVLDDIIHSIELTGIKVNKFDNDQIGYLEQSEHLEINTNQISLFIVDNTDDISHIENQKEKFGNNILYIALNNSTSDIPADNVLSILPFDKGKMSDYYKFYIKFLIKSFESVKKLNEQDDLLTEFDNINNNVPQGTVPDNTVISSDKLKLFYINHKYYTLLLISVLSVGFGLTIYSLLNHEKTPEIGFTAKNIHIISDKNNLEKKVYYLPLRNKHFTGREKHFEEIKANLNGSKLGIKTQYIVGAAGIGKSYLATEYSYRSIENKEYDRVLWISAEDLNNINNFYNDLSEDLKLNTRSLTPEQTRKLVHNTLSIRDNVKRILIILDNANNINDVKNYLEELHMHFPIQTKIHVLVSSRNQHWLEQSLILDVFSPEESELFVRRHLSHEKDKDISNLTKSLHYFPLALSQAVGYIKQHTNIENYLKLFHKKKQQYLNISQNESTQNSISLWKTTTITLDKLSNHAKEILYISSYLAPDNIQIDLFSDISIENKEHAIQELREHSFVILTDHRKTFKIHRLLQEIIRLKIANNPKWLYKVMKLANRDAKSFNKKSKDNWARVKYWFIHIATVQQYIKHDLKKADLLHNYGKIAKFFGQYSLAQELYSISLQIQEDYYKESDNIHLAETLNRLGIVKWYLGYYNEAKNLYTRSLEIKEKHYKDPMNIELASSLSNLASVEWKIGHYKNAKNIYKRVLQIQENYYKNPGHIAIASSLRGISDSEYLLGNYSEAKKLSTRELKIKQNHFHDPEHIFLARSIRSLGIIEWSLGNYRNARKLFNNDLKIRDDHYQDSKHIELTHSLSYLGLLECSLNNYMEAKRILKKTLEIMNAHYQETNHIDLAFPLYNLHLAEQGLGNYDAALAHQQKAFEIWNKNHKDLLHTVLAHKYSPIIPWPQLSKNNRKKAERFFYKSLNMSKKLFGDNHHFVARAYYMLGQACEANNNMVKARGHYKKSLEIVRNIHQSINNTIQTGVEKNITLVQTKLNNVSS